MAFRTMNERRSPRLDSRADLMVNGRELDLVDLSAQGLCANAPKPMNIGETLPFVLQLPAGGCIEGKARVKWTQTLGRKHSHGLEFVEMRPWVRHTLTKHLNPRHVGWVEWCDLFLQFACALSLVLAAKAFFAHNPFAVQAAVEYLPWAFIGGGVMVALYLASPS